MHLSSWEGDRRAVRDDNSNDNNNVHNSNTNNTNDINDNNDNNNNDSKTPTPYNIASRGDRRAVRLLQAQQARDGRPHPEGNISY